ncbi:MAG: hypothetical protein M3441_03165 [Chloroflexota bacterium]|nr:hypothetical protein [Chloroflexota bacterium]
MTRKWTVAACVPVAAIMLFSAVALAQTPPPTSTPTAGNSTTPTSVGTPPGPPASTRTVIPLVEVPETLYKAGGGPFAFANPFEGTGRMELLWTRTDKPVKEELVARTWMWGPGPNTPGLLEQYNEDPSGRGRRLVQYFDKSRMEINNPHGNWNTDFYVTNGLLTTELVSGVIQVGEKEYVPYRPACIRMTGDFGDTQAPTYAAFREVSNSVNGDRYASNLTGHKVTQTIDGEGKTGNDPSKGSVPGVEVAYFEAKTGHNIPGVFWEFLNSSGQVYEIEFRDDRLVNNEELTEEALSRPWNYASGLPISEAYWTKASIRGKTTDVLVQAYERRVLTYVPTNRAGFQVEMGNIGQHYFDWRYRNGGLCPGDAQVPSTPAVPVPAPTGTIAATTPTILPLNTPQSSPTGSVMPDGTTTPPLPTNIPPPTGTITPVPPPTDTAEVTAPAQPTGSPTPAIVSGYPR